MATQWQTFPVEFRGGLLSNMSLLQQGANAVGSARILQNFEVNKEGGYSKIRGYEAFSNSVVPGSGVVLGLKVVSSGRYIAARKVDQNVVDTVDVATAYVNGAVTSSTNVLIDRTYAYPTAFSTTTVTGSGSGAKFFVTKTDTAYTTPIINNLGTGYVIGDTLKIDGTNFGGTTSTNDLLITITNVGLNGEIFSWTVSGTPPSLGTITVGMTVTGTGITGTVKVATVNSQTDIVLDTGVTLSDDVALTFKTFSSTDIGKTAYYYSTGGSWNFTALSTNTNGGRIRHATYNFDGDEKVVFVDGTNYPSIYNTVGNTQTFLSASSTNINTDVEGAEFVTIFKRTGFYAKENTLYFAAPFTVDNFSAADGAGVISLAHNITGLAVFREQLIVFTTDSISRLVGNTSNDFQLQPITEKIGCVNGDTIQEVGGDIMYLAPDGIRQLSATDRIGDFALDVASDKIKEDFNDFLGGTTIFSSLIIREKSQYRVFSYKSSQQAISAKGLIATKVTPQGSAGIEWSTVKGIKAYVTDSTYSGMTEAVAFANNDGYVYTLETGSVFNYGDRDPDNIEAIFESSYMPITDPQVRKTFYKSIWYIDPTGSLDLDFNVKFDFESRSRNNVIQPNSIKIANTSGSVAFFGAGALFGTGAGAASFGGQLERIYPTNVIGSGKTIALRIADNSNNSTFTLDTAVLEFKQNDRQ